MRKEPGATGLPSMIKRDTPPSMEEEVAWVGPEAWRAGVVAWEDEVGRRPSVPALRVDREVFRASASTTAGLAVAEMDDMAGGALAASEGVRRREVMAG